MGFLHHINERSCVSMLPGSGNRMALVIMANQILGLMQQLRISEPDDFRGMGTHQILICAFVSIAAVIPRTG